MTRQLQCQWEGSRKDRAIWVADVLEADGLRVFLDRTNLEKHSDKTLQEAVTRSKGLVLVVDPFTFESEWVVKENEWARDSGIPIIALYDGDRYQWDQARWLVRILRPTSCTPTGSTYISTTSWISNIFPHSITQYQESFSDSHDSLIIMKKVCASQTYFKMHLGRI